MQRIVSALVQFGRLLGQLLTQDLVLVSQDERFEGFVVRVTIQASEDLLSEVVEVVEVLGRGVYLLGLQVWAVWSGASGRCTGKVLCSLLFLLLLLFGHVLN